MRIEIWKLWHLVLALVVMAPVVVGKKRRNNINNSKGYNIEISNNVEHSKDNGRRKDRGSSKKGILRGTQWW